VRPPDWDKIERLVREGQARYFQETGRKLSVRAIGPLLRHPLKEGEETAERRPFGVNVVRSLVTGPRAQRSHPGMDTLYALAEFFGDDPSIWLEAGGYPLQQDGTPLTPPLRQLFRRLAHLSEDGQQFVVDMALAQLSVMEQHRNGTEGR
jgi:hypothetical protein